MSNPNSYDEWMQLADQHARSARILADAGEGNTAIAHIGTSIECRLKAIIMRHEGFNRWPDFGDRPDLYKHSLPKLFNKSGLTLPAKPTLKANWHVVSTWDRLSSYDPNPMPKRVAMDWIDAAFGVDGVVTWLK